MLPLVLAVAACGVAAAPQPRNDTVTPTTAPIPTTLTPTPPSPTPPSPANATESASPSQVTVLPTQIPANATESASPLPVTVSPTQIPANATETTSPLPVTVSPTQIPANATESASPLPVTESPTQRPANATESASPFPVTESPTQRPANATESTSPFVTPSSLPAPPAGDGLLRRTSDDEPAPTLTKLRDAIDESVGISFFRTVDHTAEANAVGLPLDFTTVTFFRYNAVYAEILAKAPVLGLELPLRTAVWERDGTTVVAHAEAASVLAYRFRITDPEVIELLETLDDMSETLAQAAAGPGAAVRGRDLERRLPASSGIVTMVSNNTFGETLDIIEAEIARLGIDLFFVYDHTVAASEPGSPITLLPNSVVVFGNPNLGTPIMEAEPALGGELPLKIQVQLDRDADTGDEAVRVSYTDPYWLRDRFEVDGLDQLFDVAASVVDNIASAAIRVPAPGDDDDDDTGDDDDDDVPGDDDDDDGGSGGKGGGDNSVTVAIVVVTVLTAATVVAGFVYYRWRGRRRDTQLRPLLKGGFPQADYSATADADTM